MKKSIVIGSDRDLRSWLFEQDQGGAAPAAGAAPAGAAAPGAAPAAGAAGGGTIDTPWVTPEQDKELKAAGPNRADKNGSPSNDVNMLQGESPENLWKIAMELLKYGRSATDPKVAIDNYGFATWKGEADGAKFLAGMGGPEQLKARIGKINSGAAGLIARAEMPVLLSKNDIEIKNPETGETVASGKQDQVAADLLTKGAIDVKAPFAAAKNQVQEHVKRSIISNPIVSSYILETFCAANRFQLINEQNDAFPTNLTAANKDDYLTKGLRDGNVEDDAGAIPANKGAAAPVSSLEPSQSDVYLSKALGFGFGKKYEGDPVIIAGNKILDGHHRWAGASLAEPGFQMKGIQIGSPDAAGVDQALKALRSMGNAMGNAQRGGAEEVKKESVNEYRIYIRRGIEPSFDLVRWQRMAGIKR